MAESAQETQTKSEEIKQRWNGLANWYSSKMAGPLTVVSFHLISALPMPANPKVLEVGCGDGRLAAQIRMIRPDMTYTGIDVAQKMIDLAKERMPESSFSLGDAENLSFDDNTFDAYVSSLVLQIVDKPEKMLAEALRVLKPGGVAGFAIWGPQESSSFWDCIGKANAAAGNSLSSVRNFHLSNDNFKELNEILATVQFSKRVQFNADTCFPILCGNDFLQLMGKSKDLTEEQQEKYNAALVRETELILGENKPVSFGVTILILKK